MIHLCINSNRTEHPLNEKIVRDKVYQRTLYEKGLKMKQTIVIWVQLKEYERRTYNIEESRKI